MPNNIRGLGSVRKMLKDLRKTSDKAVQKGIVKTAKAIQVDAKNFAPKDTAALEQSIQLEEIPLGAKVGSNLWYAPFKEFGTGPFVLVPKGQEDYAFTFYVNGKGNTAPQPFLFPALFKNQDSLVPNIEEELAKALKQLK